MSEHRYPRRTVFGDQHLVPAQNGPNNPPWKRDDAEIGGLTGSYEDAWLELAHEGVTFFDCTAFPTSEAHKRIYAQLNSRARHELGEDARITIRRFYSQIDCGALYIVAVNDDGRGVERVMKAAGAYNDGAGEFRAEMQMEPAR